MAYEQLSKQTLQYRTALLASSATTILLELEWIGVRKELFGPFMLQGPLALSGITFGLASWWMISFMVSASADLATPATNTPASAFAKKMVALYDEIQGLLFNELKGDPRSELQITEKALEYARTGAGHLEMSRPEADVKLRQAQEFLQKVELLQNSLPSKEERNAADYFGIAVSMKFLMDYVVPHLAYLATVLAITFA